MAVPVWTLPLLIKSLGEFSKTHQSTNQVNICIRTKTIVRNILKTHVIIMRNNF